MAKPGRTCLLGQFAEGRKALDVGFASAPAFVERTGNITAGEIDAYCKANLANFKRPRRIVFVDQIPKSPVGKLLRRLLVAGEYTEIQ